MKKAKPIKRLRVIELPLTKQEHEALRAAAKGWGCGLQEFIRTMALTAAGAGPQGNGPSHPIEHCPWEKLKLLVEADFIGAPQGRGPTPENPWVQGSREGFLQVMSGCPGIWDNKVNVCTCPRCDSVREQLLRESPRGPPMSCPTCQDTGLVKVSTDKDYPVGSLCPRKKCQERALAREPGKGGRVIYVTSPEELARELKPKDTVLIQPGIYYESLCYDCGHGALEHEGYFQSQDQKGGKCSHQVPDPSMGGQLGTCPCPELKINPEIGRCSCGRICGLKEICVCKGREVGPGGDVKKALGLQEYVREREQQAPPHFQIKRCQCEHRGSEHEETQRQGRNGKVYVLKCTIRGCRCCWFDRSDEEKRPPKSFGGIPLQKRCTCRHVWAMHRVRDQKCLVEGCTCPRFAQVEKICGCGHKFSRHRGRNFGCSVGKCVCKQFHDMDDWIRENSGKTTSSATKILAKPKCEACGGKRFRLRSEVSALGDRKIERFGPCPDCSGGPTPRKP